MRTIPLTQDQVALVDDKNFEWLNQWKWYAVWNGRYWYACRGVWDKKEKLYKRIWIHRLIVNAPIEQQVDHRNHNGLDNCEHNLRLATPSQNTANQQKRAKKTSKYKGVSWIKKDKIWQVKIGVNHKCLYLGSFDSEIKAARIYDQTAKKHFGEFAYLNFGDGI